MARQPVPLPSAGAPWARRRTTLAPVQAPAPHYYAENLSVVVADVRERYGDLLTEAERRFGSAILGLSAAGLRLLARLAARRPVLREDRLRYAEVPDVPAALAELAGAGLVERCPPVAPAELLPLFTAAELRRCFFEVPSAGVAKTGLIGRIAATVPASFCRWRLRRQAPWLRLAQRDRLRLYRLLYFGHPEGDLAAFVLRDLGMRRYEAVPWSPQQRLFAHRATLQRYLDIIEASDAIAALGPKPAVGGCRAAIDALLLALWDAESHRLLERRRSRALNRLGRSLERSGEFDLALACYRRSTLPPARERRMRILARLGDEAGVERLRREIRAAPWSALEQDFAHRFGRPRKRPPLLQRELDLPAAAIAAPGDVERAALRLLTAAGGVGWHLENHLPMALFALAYWEWLFAPIPGAFVNAFQTGPMDLGWPDFFAAREGLCAEPLAAPLKPQLRDRLAAKAGLANPLFDWRRCPPAVLGTVIDAMPETHLSALVAIVRGDLAGRRSGFPDLAIVQGPGRYQFVEVKGPKDRLSVQQRLWIEALQAKGLPVCVARLRPCPAG